MNHRREEKVSVPEVVQAWVEEAKVLAAVRVADNNFAYKAGQGARPAQRSFAVNATSLALRWPAAY